MVVSLNPVLELLLMNILLQGTFSVRDTVAFGPYSILRVFAYSFLLLSSFRFLEFVVDDKLDLRHSCLRLTIPP